MIQCTMTVSQCKLKCHTSFSDENIWRLSLLMPIYLETTCFKQYIRGQRESLFQLRDENENFFYPISHIETRRDENFLTLNLGLRDEIEKNSPSISVLETGKCNCPIYTVTACIVNTTMNQKVWTLPFICMISIVVCFLCSTLQ